MGKRLTTTLNAKNASEVTRYPGLMCSWAFVCNWDLNPMQHLNPSSSSILQRDSSIEFSSIKITRIYNGFITNGWSLWRFRCNSRSDLVYYLGITIGIFITWKTRLSIVTTCLHDLESLCKRVSYPRKEEWSLQISHADLLWNILCHLGGTRTPYDDEEEKDDNKIFHFSLYSDSVQNTSFTMKTTMK